MITRRDFVGTIVGASTVGYGFGSAATASQPQSRKKLAVITTEWRYGSHAWHMAERFLAGYPHKGRWHRPAIDVMQSLAQDQKRHVTPYLAIRYRVGAESRFLNE